MDPRSKTQDPSPLELIAAGDRAAADIARDAGVSVLELARIVTTPDNLKQLHQVAQLHAIQREMLLGQLKLKALVRLAELTDEVAAASADEIRASEIMRKACVDLLRYGAPGPGSVQTRIPSPPAHADTLSPLGEEKVLAFLERMGQEDEDEDEDKEEEGPRPGGQAPIAQIAQMGRGENGNGYENGYEPRAQASGSVPPESPPPPEVAASPEIRSTFNTRARNGPGACASGSYSPPETHTPPETPTDSPSHTDVRPDVRSSFIPHSRNGPGARASGSLGIEPDVSEGCVSRSSGNNTGKMPVPPPSPRGIAPAYAKRTLTRTPSTENRQRKPDNRKFLDDAHPP